MTRNVKRGIVLAVFLIVLALFIILLVPALVNLRVR